MFKEPFEPKIYLHYSVIYSTITCSFIKLLFLFIQNIKIAHLQGNSDREIWISGNF